MKISRICRNGYKWVELGRNEQKWVEMSRNGLK